MACNLGSQVPSAVASQAELPTIRLLCIAERSEPGPRGEVNDVESIDVTDKQIKGSGSFKICSQFEFFSQAQKTGRSHGIQAEKIKYANVH